MITFSVITVTYNAAALCEQTFRSVAEQTHPYVEHLIMDGASKDNTLELAKAYQEDNHIGASNHEVKVFSEPDKGLYDAMNKGLRLATGDYVVFLNAGDIFPSSSTLELISDTIKASGSRPSTLDSRPSTLDLKTPPLGGWEGSPAVIYGDTDVVDENYHVLCRRKGNVPDKLSWRSFRRGMLVCHQAFYARTDIAKLTPYNIKYRYSADVDWCIRIMKEAAVRQLPLVNVHATIAYFQQGGMTTIHHRDSLKERFRVMTDHYGLFATLLSHAWFIVKAIIKKARTH